MHVCYLFATCECYYNRVQVMGYQFRRKNRGVKVLHRMLVQTFALAPFQLYGYAVRPRSDLCGNNFLPFALERSIMIRRLREHSNSYWELDKMCLPDEK